MSRATGTTDLTGQTDDIFSESCSSYGSVDSCTPASLLLLQPLCSPSTLTALTLPQPGLLPPPPALILERSSGTGGYYAIRYAFGTEIAFVKGYQVVVRLGTPTKVPMRKISFLDPDRYAPLLILEEPSTSPGVYPRKRLYERRESRVSLIH